MGCAQILFFTCVLGAVCADQLLNEKFAPKYDGFKDNGFKGTITMYANLNKPTQGNLQEIETKDAQGGWVKQAAEAAHRFKASENHAKLFQDLPLLNQGFNEVEAGKNGFRFKNEKTGKEVACLETRNGKGLRTADNQALEFKFTCDASGDQHRFAKAKAGYWPYYWNGGGYWGSGVGYPYAAGTGYPWYGGYGGWGYGWGYPTYSWGWGW